MAAPHRCETGHELSPFGGRRPCPACRAEAIAAQVAVADPTLAPRQITQAIQATVTSPAVLRDLAAAFIEGPAPLAAGAPAVVGRLVAELVARGSCLPLPSCAVCGRSNRPLIRSGETGVCPRCRSHQLAAPCARCGGLRRVYGRNTERAPLCWACAQRPKRCCGVCGEVRTIAKRARGDEPDVCVNCYELPEATCERCGRARPCNFVAAGHPICASCSPRPPSPCAHCGAVRPPSARWPEGPVCEPCYRKALARRGVCAGCGELRRLMSPPGRQARLCCDCAGVAPLSTCRECGIEDRLHEAGRCVRCVLEARGRNLLADASGRIPPALVAVHASISAARQPYSALNWLRAGAGAEILGELASGKLAATHEALDAHPRRRAADYLRQVLVANGALAARHEELARLERWIKSVLEGLGRPEDRRLVQAYATWSVLSRLRRRAEAGGVVRTRHAKTRIGAAVAFLAWLETRQRSLGEVCQPDVEAWLASDPPSSYDVAGFLGWAAEARLVANLEVPTLGSCAGSALDDEARWSVVEGLLHDDRIDLTDRVAGCLVLLYAQQLSRIVAITTDQVIDRGDGVHLRLGTDEVVVPEPLGSLLLGLVATGRRYVGVGSPASTPWLFPGHLPGRPLTASRLGQRLGKLGIDARAGRRTALMHLAARLPAAVLAGVLNLSPGTAVDWVQAAGGDWSSYAAQVARDRDRGRC